MSQHRFYCSHLTKNQKNITLLNKDEIHHLIDVLRLKKGANITLFNGQGTEASGEILKISKESIEVKILSKKTEQAQKTCIVLACAIPKKSKFETIIEKCTELGVDEIIPLKTKRTEIKLSDEKSEKKLKRFQSVCINASKQSKRNILPKIHRISTLNDALKHLEENCIGFIGSLGGKRQELRNAITKDLKLKKKIVFFIGPEGDFTPDEIALAIKSHCIPISLGKTTLKVDTAAIGVVAFANFIINT
ncbi:MAG: RsmE family RNA methyltransferase [Candidatus Omnitrophica bacterium]|nr:RsmE family RNA methyltransferase [Candidatus Omnitrophota bacterium]